MTFDDLSPEMSRYTNIDNTQMIGFEWINFDRLMYCVWSKSLQLMIRSSDQSEIQIRTYPYIQYVISIEKMQTSKVINVFDQKTAESMFETHNWINQSTNQ